ncbi:MAG: glycosyltransferase family 8 protein [Sphaerochaeta sp.]
MMQGKNWLDSLPTQSLPDDQYIGLFTNTTYLVPKNTNPTHTSEDFFSARMVDAYQLDMPQLFAEALGPEKVLAPVEIQLKQSLQTYLVSSCGIAPSSLDRFLSIMQNHYPAYAEVVSTCLQQSRCLPAVATVMSRSLFIRFLSFITDVYDRFFTEMREEEISYTFLISFEHLLVLLFQVFLAAECEGVVKRTSSVYFLHADTPAYLPSWRDDAVPVVFASNEKFAPALGVCLKSMLSHIDPNRFYDVVVLESDLQEDSKQRLLYTCSTFSQVQLRFFNPKALLGKRTLQKNPTDHITTETYYRFLIADILPEYEKVLYLDCDTVVLEDVSKLYDLDLQGKVLAAALDPEVPSLSLSGDPSMKEYLQKTLGFADGDAYFQAGVLVIDMKAMRALHSVSEWIALVGERRYRFNDQDLLNKECRGKFLVLAMNWNTVVDCNHTRIKTIADGPLSIYQAYTEAREHPYLVHYAGFEKPWDAIDSDFAYLFWHYAKKSEFYERLVRMALESDTEKNPSLMLRLFPRGSRRRRIAKQLFYKWSHL